MVAPTSLSCRSRSSWSAFDRRLLARGKLAGDEGNPMKLLLDDTHQFLGGQHEEEKAGHGRRRAPRLAPTRATWRVGLQLWRKGGKGP